MTTQKTPFYALPGFETKWRPGTTSRHDGRARRAVLAGPGRGSQNRIVVDYSEPDLRLALESAGEVLVCGEWGLEIRWAGRLPTARSKWEQTCWFSDQDADYLELAVRLEGGLRVERSILLAKADRFVYLADALLGPRSATLGYCGRLALAPGVAGRAAARSRECRLAAGQARARVLPLALGEWRADGQPGGLAIEAGTLSLCHESEGRRLLAPLWIDLDRRRIERPFTWRRLTVAQDRAIVPGDLAAGYRVQAGARQWLVYRSLGPRGNRTLLGHNLSTELLVGRFTKSGEVEKLVEIE